MDTLAHGIGVTNRFELFYNEDVDPLEILRQQEEEKQRRKVEKTHPKDKKPVKTGKVPSNVSPKKPLESVPNKSVKNADQVEVPNKPRGDRKPDNRPPRQGGNYHDNKEGEKNARNKDDHFFNPDQRDRADDYRRGGRGGGGYRGGRGGRVGDRGGRGGGGGYVPGPEGRTRRMFDRHSGSDKTGVRPTEKREGSGPGNWGDTRSDIIQHSKQESTWDDDFEGGDARQTATNWGEVEPTEPATFGGEGGEETAKEGVSGGEEAKDGEQTEEQMQEAIKEMTLDEYKKEQEAKRFVPKFNLRKPGEGEDTKQWQKGYVLKKKPVETDEDQDEEEEDDEDEHARKEKQKVLLDFQFNFTDSRRGTRGRGRGGRGGPRGGARDGPMRDGPPREDRMRENRGPRGGGPPRSKPGQQAPRVDDINDFPSLVSA